MTPIQMMMACLMGMKFMDLITHTVTLLIQTEMTLMVMD